MNPEKQPGSSPQEVADYLNEQKNPENDDEQVEELDEATQENDPDAEDDSVDPEDDPKAEELEDDTEELEESAILTLDDMEGYSFNLNIDGDDQEVTLEELQRGYMRDGDYTRKTEELAKDKRDFEAEREDNAGLGKLRQQYVEQLEVIEAALSQPYSDDQLAKIKEEDGFEVYMEAKDQNDGFAKKIGAIKAERENTINKVIEDQKREHEKKLVYEKSQLAKVAPELTKKEGMERLSKYLIGEGFTPEVVNSTSDHMLLVLAEKARKYDQLMKKGKGKPKPKKLKVFKRKASQNNKAVVQSKQLREVKDRAVRSGSPKDIAAYQLAKRKTTR